MSFRHLFAISAMTTAIVLGAAFYRLADVHADSFPPVSPDELKMTSEPQAPGAPAIILYRQVDRDDRGLTAHENHYERIKILKEEGRKYADVEIPFFRSFAA